MGVGRHGAILSIGRLGQPECCVVQYRQIQTGSHALRWRWAPMLKLADLPSNPHPPPTKLTTMY